MRTNFVFTTGSVGGVIQNFAELEEFLYKHVPAGWAERYVREHSKYPVTDRTVDFTKR